jgi:hypothetical protein
MQRNLDEAVPFPIAMIAEALVIAGFISVVAILAAFGGGSL